MAQTSNENLGRWGEKQFESLCAAHNLVANKADHDAMGWDYIVQMPPVTTTKRLLDKRPMGAACLTQVKTVWKTDRPRVKLSLSAAERLAKFIGPAFILMIIAHEDEAGHPKLDGLHLLHLDGRPMARILKRLREVEVGAKTQPLNQQTISFAVSEGGHIDPDGADLVAALAAASGPEPDAYVQAKQRTRDNLGYGDDRIRIEATFQANDEDHLVDMLLGLTPADITDASVFDVRFGLKALIDQPTQWGTVSWTFEPHPIRRTTIRVRGPMLMPPVVFQADIIIPPVENLSPEVRRIVFRTDFFTLTVNGQHRITIAGTTDGQSDALPLSTWRRNLRLLDLMNGPIVTFEIDGGGERPNWPITVTPSREHVSGPIKRDLVAIEALESIAEAAGAGDLICDYAALTAQLHLIDIAAAIFVNREITHFTPIITPLPSDEAGTQVLTNIDTAEALYTDRLIFGTQAILISARLALRQEIQTEQMVWHVETVTPQSIRVSDASDATFETFVATEAMASPTTLRMRPPRALER